SNHLSRPKARTRSTSPGRTPKVKRFKAWIMRLSSSICGIAVALVLDFDFLSPATSKTAETASKRPRKTTARRIVGIDAPEGSCFQKNTNPKPAKSCRCSTAASAVQGQKHRRGHLHPNKPKPGSPGTPAVPHGHGQTAPRLELC